jgi:transposase, IS5 family
MLGKSPDQNAAQEDIFRSSLRSLINPKQELVLLSAKIDWKSFEDSFAHLYSRTGTPSKPIRLMVGLLLLKQMCNLSDESVVAAWVQNPYYQYFTGETHFCWRLPCDPSDLVHFRNRIGKEGAEKIFSCSVSLFAEEVEKADVVNVDSTVQEKNITFPTDTKLAIKIINRCKKLAKEEGIVLRQTYTRTVKKNLIRVRFAHHPKRKKEGKSAMKTIKNIAGRLVRDVKRKLNPESLVKHLSSIERYEKVLAQKPTDKNKIYSLHEPDVACIAKGKSHKPYEFGCKVGFATLPKSNIIVGVAHFEGNPHDSQTLETTLESAEMTTKKHFRKAVVDRGYRGKSTVGETEVVIPNEKKDRGLTKNEKAVKRKLCRGRAAIEPLIGHLKSDHRMAINYLKGKIGDAFNALMSAAAFNFKKYLNRISATFFFLLFVLSKLVIYFSSFDSKGENRKNLRMQGC